MVFPHPFEKYARQIGSNPQGSGWKLTKIFELPPSSLRWSLLLGGRVFQGVSTLDFPMIFVPSVLSPAGRFGTPRSPECQSDSSPSQRTNLGQQQRLPTPTCFLCEDLRWHHNIRWISGETKTYKQKNSKHFTETGGLAPWGKKTFHQPMMNTPTQNPNDQCNMIPTYSLLPSSMINKKSSWIWNHGEIKWVHLPTQPTNLPPAFWGGSHIPPQLQVLHLQCKVDPDVLASTSGAFATQMTRSCSSKKTPPKGHPAHPFFSWVFIYTLTLTSLFVTCGVGHVTSNNNKKNYKSQYVTSQSSTWRLDAAVKQKGTLGNYTLLTTPLQATSSPIRWQFYSMLWSLKEVCLSLQVFLFNQSFQRIYHLP